MSVAAALGVFLIALAAVLMGEQGVLLFLPHALVVVFHTRAIERWSPELISPRFAGASAAAGVWLAIYGWVDNELVLGAMGAAIALGAPIAAARSRLRWPTLLGGVHAVLATTVLGGVAVWLSHTLLAQLLASVVGGGAAASTVCGLLAWISMGARAKATVRNEVVLLLIAGLLASTYPEWGWMAAALCWGTGLVLAVSSRWAAVSGWIGVLAALGWTVITVSTSEGLAVAAFAVAAVLALGAAIKRGL